MLGGIYSDERCPDCGKKLKDNKVNACICPEHPDRRASKFKVIFPPNITRRFSNYPEAAQFLNGLRYEYSQNKFDERNYKTSNPLGFSNLADKWLDEKEHRDKVADGTLRHYKRFIKLSKEDFKNTNIKEITGRMIGELIDKQPVGDKRKHMMCSCLHTFWQWVFTYDEDKPLIDKMPTFPKYNFRLGLRKITDKETQLTVLDRIQEIAPFRVWLAIRFLCGYPALRPDDIRRIREGDIDRQEGLIRIERPTKNKKTRGIWIAKVDLDIINSLPKSMPHMPFFRHEKDALPQVKKGDVFGRDYLSKWWKQACKDLGLIGVALYGGTRHTSTTALQSRHTPSEIKTYATQHESNKAFERYFFPDREKSLQIASIAWEPTKKEEKKVVSIKQK